ncbi:unnamed protein product [Echinostoma caproni]|uniref:MFS domain-containing protein n=1 Tax=Echinostoma caproni TaxID=27848 RepID=A0A183AEP2_9TREM|nr:unnamed protein product [Echinostoma caproni]
MKKSQEASDHSEKPTAETGLWNSSQCTDNSNPNEDPGMGDLYGTTLEIDLDDLEPPLPPDGGYGWFIVLGSFVCMVLVDGVCFSYGIFLSELEATFGATKMQMTLAGSLLTGPIVSGLMNRFGARILVLIGSIISSVSIVISSFARDVNMFIVVFGVIGGIGYGLVYLPAATIVTTWFVKKRATVTGIIMAGSGIGVTVYSLTLPHLISLYTWRGCILILSAINLNCAVAGALFRPLNHYLSKKPVEEGDNVRSENGGYELGVSIENAVGHWTSSQHISKAAKGAQIQELARQYVVAELGQSAKKLDGIKSATGNSELGEKIAEAVKRKSTTSWDDLIITYGNQLVPLPEGQPLGGGPSTDRLPMLSVDAVNRIVEDVLGKQTFMSSTSLVVPDRSIIHRSSNMGSQRMIQSTASQLGQVSVRPTDKAVVYLKPDNMGSTSYFASAISLRAGCEGPILTDENVKAAIVNELRKEIARPVHKKDLFLSGSLIHINEYVAHPEVDQYIRSVTSPADEKHTRNPFLSMLKNLFGIEILRSPTFVLLTVSSIVTMIGYIVPYQFLKDNAQTYGYDEAKSSYLLAYLGIANTIGRVLAGWLSDRPWADVILVNNISLVLSGIATALVPLMNTYPLLLAYACFYGFVIAAFIAVRTILIVEVLGLDRLTNAFGFLLLFQGMAIVAAPPLLGSLYDTFHNFGFTFILGGAAIFLSGVLCFPLSAVARWERRRSCQADLDQRTEISDPNTQTGGIARLIRLVRDQVSRFCFNLSKPN